MLSTVAVSVTPLPVSKTATGCLSPFGVTSSLKSKRYCFPIGFVMIGARALGRSTRARSAAAQADDKQNFTGKVYHQPNNSVSQGFPLGAVYVGSS